MAYETPPKSTLRGSLKITLRQRCSVSEFITRWENVIGRTQACHVRGGLANGTQVRDVKVIGLVLLKPFFLLTENSASGFCKQTLFDCTGHRINKADLN